MSETPPKLTGQAEERQTLNSPDARSALEDIGERFAGLDGKRYLGTMCVHVYDIPSVIDKMTYLFYSQSTDLRKVPENVALEAIKEMSRSIMIRYGRKPPRKTTDSQIIQHEDSRA